METFFKVLSLVFLVIAIVLFFSRRKAFYKFAFVSFLLFPKVNLISVGGSTTGIRFDDLLMLASFILLLPKILSVLRKSPRLAFVHGLIILWVVCGLISLLVGMGIGTVNSPLISVLTSIRKYEYFVAIFIGYFYFKNYSKKDFLKTIKIVTVVLLAICLLQYTHLIGGFVSGSYVSVVGFPIGVFNGAYEFACFMCIMLVILFYNAIKKDHSCYLFCLIALIQIVLTQSRSGLLLSVFIILAMSLFYAKKLFFAALILGGITSVILINTTSILQRFASIEFEQMYWVFVERIQYGVYMSALKELPHEAMFVKVTTDLSFYVRATKWGAAINGFTMSPIFGYGPGQLAVLDGSYVKIICEGGLISAIIFVVLLVTLFKDFNRANSSVSKWILVSVMCFALFIDIFDSSKIMEMFWMFAGSAYAMKTIRIQVDEKVVTLKLKESI